MRKALILTLVIAVMALGAFVCIKYYPFVFAKTVDGVVVKVERVNQTEAIIASGRNIPAAQLFSYGIAIRDAKGDIHTSSSEDRQWSVVQSGQCAEAKLFPYPPWDFEAAGTFHNARLIRLYDCPKK